MKPGSLFTVGAQVRTADAMRGRLKRVAVDPGSGVVTHLVVAPAGGGKSRLVPVGLVDRAAPVIELRCTADQFARLEPAEVADPPQETAGGAPPSHGPGAAGAMRGADPAAGPGAGAKPRVVTHEVVAHGRVGVRKGEHARAVDGSIGTVDGLVADPQTHHVTHVLLNEGHLWNGKTVAIPIGNVTSVHDGVQLSLTKRQVKDLPAVDTGALAAASAAAGRPGSDSTPER